MRNALLLCCFPFLVFSQKIVLDTAEPKNVTAQMYVLTAADSTKGIEDIRREKFVPFGKEVYLSLASAKTLWLKTEIENRVSTQNDWILEFGDKGIKRYEFFEPDTAGHYKITLRGMEAQKKFPISALFYGINPHLSFRLLPAQTKTIYVKITGDQSRAFRMRVLTPEEFNQRTLKNSIQNSFLLGALLIRLIYVFLLAVFAVKDRIFRVYGLHLLLCALAFFGVFATLGWAFTSSPSVAIIINNLSTHLLGFSYFLFTLTLLPLDRLPAFIRHLLRAGLVLNIVAGLLLIFNYNWIWVNVSLYMTTFYWFIIFGLFGFVLLKKISINWYYAIPFLLGNGYGGFAFLQTMAAGWYSDHIVFIDALFRLIFIIEFIFFGYFIGKIIRDYERNRVFSQKQLAFEKAQAERLSELDNLKTGFFTNISHEFRTPLTLILAPLKELQQEFPGREIFQIMQRNAERLLELINQLLDLSKLEAGKMQLQIREGDLAQFLRQLLASFESLAQSKHLLFQYELRNAPPAAYFDADKVGKITTNLLSNAFKFTPEQGRIQVIVEFSERECTLHVIDNGIGIDTERLPLIFDRFYQADSSNRRNFEGTGVGLALVKELVDILKGTITVQSQPGAGTAFQVIFPWDKATWKEELSQELLSEEESYQLPVSLPSLTPMNRPGDTAPEENVPLLLLLEDNTDLRTYVRRILEGTYRIEEAQDGQAGLEKAIEVIPDLVICDLMMPRLDGIGFCKALKSDLRTNHIPIILLTAKAALEDRLEGLHARADDYMIKPFHTEELKVRVDNLLTQRKALQKKYTLPDSNRQPTFPIVPSVSGPEDPFLQKVLHVLQLSYPNSQLDVEQLAREIGVTSVQLRRKLKALTDQTVTEYVRNYRLAKAAEQLRKRTATVSEIAYSTGFESLPYFSKVFAEKYGVSPGDYALSNSF
jgi:signal transduction histidine kinase/DNA-binding response OmpR family regulator